MTSTEKKLHFTGGSCELKASAGTKSSAQSQIITYSEQTKDALKYLQLLLTEECVAGQLLEVLKDWMPTNHEEMDPDEFITVSQDMVRLTNALVKVEHELRGKSIVTGRRLAPITTNFNNDPIAFIGYLLEREKLTIGFGKDGSMSEDDMIRLADIQSATEFLSGKGGAQ